MKDLANASIVITGASSGVGRATALEAATHGGHVTLLARRAGALQEVVAECEERGATARALPVDVTDADAVEEAASEVVAETGRIDVWVNNAAVHLFGAIEAVPVKDWHRVVETNVFGTYHGVRAALPWMRDRGEGTIINVSSVLGRMGAPEQSAYTASKYAIRGISDCTRLELRDSPGVSVCTVLPGPIDTPLFEQAANHSGRQIRPLRPVIDAHRVAAEILACARSPRREVVVGVMPGLTVAGERVAPGLTERTAARVVAKDHYGPAPAPASVGNLYEPAAGTGAISGGWTRNATPASDDAEAVSEAPSRSISTRAGRRLAAAGLGALAATLVVKRLRG